MNSQLQDSIVIITGTEPTNFGTGFVFYKDQSSTYLITCMHVVKDVGGHQELKANSHPATVIAFDSEDGFDLAILRIDKILDIPTLHLKAIGEKGVSAIAVGCYLYGKQRIIQKIECVLEEQVIVDSIHLNARGPCWHLKIQGDYCFQKGYSGAPVVDIKNHHVLGIVNQRKGEGEKGLAISVETLIKLWPEMPKKISLNLKLEKPKIFANPESGPLMDFKDELAAFQKIINGQDQQTRLISLFGPSLMGKSRLLREYRRIAYESNFDDLFIDLKQQIDIELCLELIVNKFGIQHFTNFNEYLSDRPAKSLSREEEREWYKNLTRKFFQDLGNYREAHHLLIFFDHYEKVDRDFKDWLNSIFLTRNFLLTPIVVIVAGQEEIKVESTWPNQYRFQLKGVEKDCCFRYAGDCNVTLSDKEIELVHEACQGSPGHFVMFVQSRLGN